MDDRRPARRRGWATITCVARMGGDEFVVLVEDWTRSRTPSCRCAQEALAAVREPLQISGHTSRCRPASAWSTSPSAETTAAELMKAADTTLYWAKAEGRNRWALFDAGPPRPGGHAGTSCPPSLPAALDRGRAVPGVPAARPPRRRDAGRRRGAGPLAAPDARAARAERVHRPRRGDRRDRRHSVCGCCAPRARRRATGGDRFPDRRLVISVNLAAAPGHRSADRRRRGRRCIAETGIDPGLPRSWRLTESAIMASAGQPLDTLHALADLGVRIAIDDFGTGYSNLAYLRTFRCTR